MAERLRYGSAPESGILAELEDLREKRDADGMITRALAPDSNIFILNEVLTSVKEGPISPVLHKDLLQAVAPSLDRKTVLSMKDRIAPSASALTAAFAPPEEGSQPQNQDLDEEPGTGPRLDASRVLKRFLFVQNALPGNCHAESICSSPDGAMLAYITRAAIKLQADRSERARKAVKLTALDRQEPRYSSRTPGLVNVICLDPYEDWSLDIAGAVPKHDEGSLELIGIDHARVFLLHERGRSKTVHVLGLRSNRLETSFDLGEDAGALELGLDGQVLAWLDVATASFIAVSLKTSERASFPLLLPTGLEARDLHRIVLSPDGELGLILVSPRATVSGVTCGLIRLQGSSEQAPAGEVRWWRRRELFLTEGFENAVVTRSRPYTIEIEDQVAFYLFGTDGALRRISLNQLREISLHAIKPLDLLSLVLVSDGSKKVLFPRMAVAAERPLLATYEQVDGAIKLWDTTDDTLLLAIPCPFHIDSLHFLAHDSLLVIRSRAMGRTSDSITIVFLDFLLCAGLSPSVLTEDFLPLIKPLRAWAPEAAVLDFMERLALFNGKAAKELVA